MRVMLHFRADGSFRWMAEDGVEVVCIDDNAPLDRIYRTTGSNDAAFMDSIIRAATAGQPYDNEITLTNVN